METNLALYVQLIAATVTIGSIYGITALGLNIIYNANKLINFAQGEFLMLGAMVAMFFTTVVRLPVAAGFVLAVLIVTAVGMLLQRVCFNPLRKAPLLTLILLTLGASVLFQGIALVLWGDDPRGLPPFSGHEPITFLGAAIAPQNLWALGINLSVAVALAIFFERTLVGKAMRACAENREAASLVGINVRIMDLASFGLSAGLGAIAGIAIAPIAFFTYGSGPELGLKGLIAAVLGGMGNNLGALVGGMALALLETFSVAFISSEYKDAIAFLALMLVLLIKPSGIMGAAR